MTRLSHLFDHVSDLDRARRFYVDDGFRMGMEQREPDQVGSISIEIVIHVPDVDKAFERLVERGHHFEAPPTDMPWGARHAWLKDPDGYPLSICS
jgi:uncharacterized glyoxalase superfamily protein PhnB